MKRKHSTKTPVCPQECLVIISYTTSLSFALERIGPLAAIIIIIFYLLVLYLFALPNTPKNLFASIYSEFLIKTTCQHLLLLVGFDTLIYRKYYDTTLMVRSRHPVGNPKRKVWWAQQQVFLSCETKVYRTSRRKPNFRRLMLASFETLQIMALEKYWCVVDVGASSPAAMWNLYTTQPSTLPQLTMRLSISPVCCKQRIKHIEW
jgi:hypothetical protein